MIPLLTVLAAAVLAAAPASLPAQDKNPDVEALKKKVEGLEKKVQDLESREQQSALDKAVQEAEARKAPAAPGIAATTVGGVGLRLIDVSLDVLFAAGVSSEPDDITADLQAGGHDPDQRGFSLTQAELSLAGAVDHLFTAEAHIVFFIDEAGETGVELEEAFLKTTDLPWGLQAKAGHFLTEFGRINPTHPHAWRWIDQPVVNSRMFGADGLRSPGVRLSWIVPLPNFSEITIGVQNARGETVGSFFGPDGEPTAVGHYLNADHEVHSPDDLLYLARWENGFDLSDEVSTLFGLSGLIGPNATGNQGATYIYGADLVVKWRPTNSQRGWPSVIFESEVIGRTYRVDGGEQTGAGLTVPTSTLKDWGAYAQVLWLFTTPWSAGLRYEFARGSGSEIDDPSTNVVIGPDEDPFRDRRQRVSPVLIWNASEFSRLRLQYNYDRAEHLPEKTSHAVWFAVDFLLGAHPAHKY